MTKLRDWLAVGSGQPAERSAGVAAPHSHAGTPPKSRSSRSHRSGRAIVTVLFVIVALGAGAAGGFWLPGRLGATGSMFNPPRAGDSDGAASGQADQWYSCGMHPNVLQQGPGDCPICGMKLTPLKTTDEGGQAASPGGSKERKVLYWRAPMDPGYISEKPGKSPMGMDLVPVYADEGESPSAHTIRIDPVTIQNMGIRTTKLKRGPLVKTIRTLGRIDYDEQLVTFINTKFGGWIEDLYVDETGQRVEKGQPLFAVYSPELYDAQAAYLASVRMVPQLADATFPEAREDALRQLEADKIKLLYYDISEEQIDELSKTKTIQKTLTIHSLAEGIVAEKMALEGMYVKPGMKLYTIADLSRVWVYVDIYEYQLPWVGVGQKATMSLPYVPGKKFEGKVVYVYPYLEKVTRVIKVRLEFENPALELKPEMYANITLATEIQGDALLIPREAYIDSGTRKVAFIYLGDGKFVPRDIQVGVEAEGGMVEVLYGLDEGEVVVTSGQFMLDAESKLKEAVAKMMEANRAPAKKKASPAGDSQRHAGHASHTGHGPPASGPTATMPADAKFACPMEEHPDETDPAEQGPYFSTEPGKCPRCGMKLKPIDQLAWAKVHLAAKGADVAYTCPDHQHVLSTSSGQCPRCGKPLRPFKVMYTCPDPEHAGVISTFAGSCPHCDQALAPFRGIWLDEAMAGANVAPNPGVAEAAAFRCPAHPLVHSDRPGRCTICAAPLQPTRVASTQPAPKQIPPGAKYTCPMHPEQVRAARPGPCPICAMQLVPVEALMRPREAPARIAAQVDYITEHYLELQKLLASDRTKDVALHTLGLASAAEEVMKHLDDPGVELAPEARDAVAKLRAAALRIRGTSLGADRVTFVDLSAAMRMLVKHLRPDKKRWPKLYIFHCPMSKGDWLQSAEGTANPYYGFKMLKCGKLQGIE